MALLTHSAATAGIDGFGAQPRPAGDKAHAALRPTPHEILIVSVAINERRIADGAVVLRESDGVWLLPDALLSAAGITVGEAPEKIDGADFRRLHVAPGIAVQYDEQAAALSLSMAPENFEGQVMSARDEEAREETSGTIPAAFAEYDVGVQAASGDVVADGSVSLGVSGGFGVAQSQWVFTTGEGDHLMRLGTSFTIDDPVRRTTLIIGDGVEASAPGMTPLAYGGVGWFSNFEIDPEFIALPLPSVHGVADRPGEVSILVNGQHGFNREIDEGDFLISDIPASVGAGKLEVVTTDLAGKRASFLQPIYVAPELLKPGLSAYAFAAGWDRLEFDDEGMTYGALFARAGVRRGISDWVTINAAAEAGANVADMALGMDMRLGAFGAASVGVSGSHGAGQGRPGYSLMGSVSRSADEFSFGLGALYASQGFSQIGLSDDVKIKARYDGNASVRLGGGTLAAGASWIERWEADHLGLATVSYSRDIGSGQITLTGSYLAGEENTSELRAIYSVPLGGRNFASSQLSRTNKGEVGANLAIGRSPPAGEGIGYGASADLGGDGVDALGRVTVRKRAFEGAIEAARRSGKTGARARVRGGLLLADGAIFAARDAGGGALLIETPGLGDTPVLLDHQQFGGTRKDGRTLIAAQPFIQHNVAIDESGLPIDVALKRSSARIATGRGRVTRILFSLAESFAQTVIVVLPDGSEPPRGTPVVANGDPDPLPVGHDGMAYLTSNESERSFALVTERGRCSFAVNFESARSRKAEGGLWPEFACEYESLDSLEQDDIEHTSPPSDRWIPSERNPVLAKTGATNIWAVLRSGTDRLQQPENPRSRRYRFMAVIALADGRAPRPGTPIQTGDTLEPYSIGYDGLAFLTSDVRQKHYSLATEGGRCDFDVYFDGLRSGEEGDGAWPVYTCR